mgnify:CR=1 FL=1
MIPEADGRPLPPIDTVWVIESPGKIACIEAALIKLGYAPQVIATRGHFKKMPESITQCGIDQSYSEHLRRANPEIVERLEFHIMRMKPLGQVFIATDADTEGDVIATDVADTIAPYYANPFRVRLRSLDPDTFEEAINEARHVNREDATPGRTRAIIDRAIGASFAQRGIAAGRIRSAILGIAANNPPPLEWLHLVAPAVDGGREWTVKFPVSGPISGDDAVTIADLSFPPLEEDGRQPFTPDPDDMGRILVRAGDELDMSPRDASRSMQAAYESGRLSYPRSDARGVSEYAATKLSSSFRKNGQIGFQRNVVKIRTAEDVHDSPWPIGPVNPALDPTAMGGPEAIRTMIAQNLYRAGLPARVGVHRPGVIKDFLMKNGLSEDVALFVDRQNWSRDIGPRKPGPAQKNGLVRRRADTALLEACVEAGIGRPSTYAAHIDNMLSNGLIDQNLRLTDQGKVLLAKTPATLLNPAFSRAIEAACHGTPPPAAPGVEPWQALAAKIVSKMPGDVGSTILNTIRQTAPAQTGQSMEQAPAPSQSRPTAPSIARSINRSGP